MSATRRWLGWAIDRPGHPLFVQYGDDEAQAWRFALGWPSQAGIDDARAHGARAFRIHITEVSAAPPLNWGEGE